MKRRRTLTGLVLALLLCAEWASAESAPYKLLESAGACGMRQYPRDPAFLCAIGDRLLFQADDDANGNELWVTDGTGAGTALVKDIVPGPRYFKITHFLKRGSSVYCRKRIDNYCGTWFKTDGTTEGTIPIQDLHLGLEVDYMDGSQPTAELADSLFFFVQDDTDKYQIWRTDFTPAGSLKITDSLNLGTIEPSYGIHPAGNRVYFLATDTGGKLWICGSDGTPSGTAKVALISQPVVNSSGGFVTQAVGNTLFFACEDSASGKELWVTDGTATGTHMVKDIWPGNGSGLTSIVVDPLLAGAPVLYFEADNGTQGRRLWRSDGTAAGTRMIDGLHPGGAIDTIIPFGRQGAVCYFFIRGAAPDSESGIWRTDGSSAERVFAADGAGPPTMSGNTLFFWGLMGRLYKIDSTVAYPVFLARISGTLYDYGPNRFITVGSTLFFWTTDGLWKTDGTAEGTVLVKSLEIPAASDLLGGGIALGSALYFWLGDQLWKSDGTEQGTVVMERGCAQTATVTQPDPHYLGTLGSFMLMTANDAKGAPGLWKSNGTVDGTAQVAPLNVVLDMPMGSNSAAMGGFLYFAVRNPDTQQYVLWRTDTTSAGTTALVSMGEYRPVEMISIGSTLFISASKVTGDGALWKSDGTAAGTVRVKPLDSPRHLTAVGSSLYFVNDSRIWKSDGTSQGTMVVSAISGDRLTLAGSQLLVATSTSGAGGHSGSNLTTLNAIDVTTGRTTQVRDLIYGYFSPATVPLLKSHAYFAVFLPENGYELWKSDGAAATTAPFKEITPGPAGSFCTYMSWAVLGEDLYFPASDSTHGTELWKTDGTAANTVMVKDIQHATVLSRGTRCADGTGGSIPHALYTCNDAVYFAADDDTTGTELWVTRGTEETTVRLADLAPGPGSSNPADLTKAGDSLIFTATDGTDRGTELWAIALPPTSPANPSAVVLGTNSILWTWDDLSVTETAFRLWADTGTGTPTTLRATLVPNSTGWRQDGLSANTPYSFRVAATGEEGDSPSTAVFTAWTLAQKPTGLLFPQVTKNSIQVTVDPVPANLAQGQSGVYLVNQTQGLNSGWIQTASGWSSAKLNHNAPYTFVGRARNGAGVETGPVAAVKYTLAGTPYAPVVDNPGVHSLDVSGIRGGGNPSYTLYAIQMSPAVGGRAWVQADGSLGDEAFFQTAGAWGVTTVTGLAEDTAYAFSALARNGEGVDTGPGAAGTGTTLDVTPPTAVITLADPNPLNADAVRFGVTFNEPVGTTFSPALITLAGTLAGTVSVTGTDPAYVVTVTLAEPDMDGTVGIVIGAGVTDLSGNAYAGGVSALYTLTHWAGFTQQPEGARKYRGDSHLLQVAVNTGGLPTTYQWKHLTETGVIVNGPGATQWLLASLNSSDPGDYWCEVTNGGIRHPSEKVAVSAMGHLRITKHPQGGAAFYGGAWQFTVEADGGYPPLHYQWRKEGQVCPGATGPEYLVDPLEQGDAGLYSVEIHDSNSDVRESYPARLTLTQRVPVGGGAALAALAGLLALAGAARVWKRRE